MSCIFLTGMPGAGKTYWGKKVAAAYQLPFTDLDEYIEQKEGKSISELFMLYEEAGFRKREAAALAEVVRNAVDGLIVACGGGTPVSEENFLLMKTAGCMVYLKAGTDTLVERIQTEPGTRPLLRTPHLKAGIEQMLAARENIYEQAAYVLQTETISVANFEQIISSCIKRH